MILGIETSSSTGSWALFEKDELLKSATFEGRASSSLVPSIQAAGLKMTDIETILIGVGPGSFGGIRVGIATAQGLSRVWGCPIIPVRSSSASAWRHRNASFLGVFADAKRNQYFFTAYEQGVLTRASTLIPRGEVEHYLSKCSLTLSPDPLDGIPLHESPEASDLIRYYLAFGPETGLLLEPLYLHPPLLPPSS